MDEQTIFNLLECAVCLEPLDVTSRSLPCQHTFCMRCLQQIINTQNALKCPECRKIVPCQTVTDLPTNILLVRLLDGLRRPGTAPGSPPPRTIHLGSSEPMPVTSTTSKGSLKNQPCAMALYKYDAQEHGDLSFNKSDIILLHKKVDDNWFQGVVVGSNDQIGFFPASYVQVLTPLPPDPPQCKALYDFEVNEQEEKDCITFIKDEVLSVIRRVDENWVEGQKGDKIGIFPLSFVELNGTAKALVDAHAGVEGSSGPFHQSQGSGDAGSGPDQAGSSQEGGSKNKVKRHSFTSLLGLSTSVQNKSKEPLASTSTSTGISIASTIALSTVSTVSTTSSSSGSGSSSNRQSMEISSPVLLHSSNPTAANLIDNKATASSSAAVSTSGTVAVTAGDAVSTTATAALAEVTHRKKPAPLIGISQCIESRGPNSPSLVASPTHTATADFKSVAEAPSSPKPKVEVYTAMFSYKATKPDELELRKGEVYTVTEKGKDGWFKGMYVKTGELGLFPGNYMQPYRHEKPSRKTPSSGPSSYEVYAPSMPDSRPMLSTNSSTSTTTTTTASSSSSSSNQSIRPHLPSDAASRANVTTAITPTNNDAPLSPSLIQGMRPRVFSDTSSRYSSQRLAMEATLTTATTQTSGSRPVSRLAGQPAVAPLTDRRSAVPDGLKTVSQLKSERAAQQMMFRPPPPNQPLAAPAKTGGTHTEMSVRGSPPTVGTQTAAVPARSSIGQVVGQAGPSPPLPPAQGTQSRQSGQTASWVVRPRVSSGPSVASSPPNHNGSSRRVHSPSSPQLGGSGVNQEASTVTEVATKPKGSPVFGQGSPVSTTPPQHHKAHHHQAQQLNTKAKRLSAQLPTATEAQLRQQAQKPRRHSESDNDPGRAPRRACIPKTNPSHPPQSSTAQIHQLLLQSGKSLATAPLGSKQTAAPLPPSQGKPSSPSVYRVLDSNSAFAMPSPINAGTPDCVGPSLVNSAKMDKKEKKDRSKVSKKHPQSSPEEVPIAPLVRGSSLPPDNHDAAQPVEVCAARPTGASSPVVTSGPEDSPQATGLDCSGLGERRDKPPKTTPLVRERYRVIVSYPTESNAELELRLGETIFVHNKRKDGWFKGTQQRTGKTGLFPGNFVESY